MNLRNNLIATAALALGTLSAVPASAQYSDFTVRCRTDSGMLQAEACMAALRYEPNNADYMRWLGDSLLTSNRPGGAFDAYTDALALRPGFLEARNGREEAMRQINGRYQSVPAIAYVPTIAQPVYVPVQTYVVPQVTAQPVIVHPYDGTWRGHIEPRGQRFSVQATVVGGQFRLYYDDSADRVVLEGTVDGTGYFSGRGILKDKAGGPSGDGGAPLTITGRFSQGNFEGTGAAGSRFTNLQLSRAGS